MQSPELKPHEQALLDRLEGAAKRGFFRQALGGFLEAEVLEASTAFLDLQPKYKERFLTSTVEVKTESGSLLGKIQSVFQAYWRRALLEDFVADEGPRFLYAGLCPIAGDEFLLAEFSEDRLSATGKKLKAKLAEEGIHSLWGRVRPHHEFMAWRSEREETASVALPGGEVVDFEITYLNDFLSLGWTGFATFDKIHNGGWAATDRLFCVQPAYDLASEKFRVSYLAHEARHFADYTRFPNLEQGDLEYRAKLTELALADETLLKLVRSFQASAFNDPASPHAFAAYRIVEGLRMEMAEVIGNAESKEAKAALREAALRLLEDSDFKLSQS